MDGRGRIGVALQLAGAFGIAASLLAPWGGWRAGQAGTVTTSGAGATAPFVIVFGGIALVLAWSAIRPLRGRRNVWLQSLLPVLAVVVGIVYVITIGQLRGGESVGGTVGWGPAVLGWSLLAGLTGMWLVTYGRDTLPAN